MDSMFGKRTLTPTPAGEADRGAGATPGKTTQVQQRLGAGAPGADAGASSAPGADRVHAAAAHGLSGPAQPLPHLDLIQRSFGRHDVTGVGARVGGAAAEGAAAMGASAFAADGQVAFAGAPDLHTAAHEAAHVVQQAGGVQLKGGVGEAGDAYERHADSVADRVVRGESAEALLDEHAGPVGAAGAAQQGLVQRRDNNGPYTGNRPEPASTTDGTYVIRSSASRVMRVGDTVSYNIEQTRPTMQDAQSHFGIRWQVIHDPAAVRSAGIPATFDGPVDQDSWTSLGASVPGLHTIKAWITLDGRQLAEPTYQQQVVAREQGPVQVPTGTAAAPLATMRDFIALVRRIEAAYAGYPWQDVVSRIRKEYYPGPGGGLLSGITAAFTWDDLIDEQECLPGLEVPPVAVADVAAIRAHQVVTTDAGASVDIGHILTGVDSFNFPGVAGIFAAYGMEGPAAATWSGDVGSALVEWAAHAPVDDNSEATKLRFYDGSDGQASLSDMLGDVDAIAIAHGPNLNLPASAPLSQRLESFYQTAPATGQQQRFHHFCRASHFNLANNQIDSATRARIRTQILQFARGYNLKPTEGLIRDAIIFGLTDPADTDPSAYEHTVIARIEREVGWFADHFIQWVNDGLAAEGP